MDLLDGGPSPKRGDIVQTNVGDRRERTWFVLCAHRINRIVRSSADLVPRYKLWIERWWELEPDFRMRLYRSAERNGGQVVSYFFRYKQKKKKRKLSSW